MRLRQVLLSSPLTLRGLEGMLCLKIEGSKRPIYGRQLMGQHALFYNS
jgi:hypothetical protein